MVTLGVILIHNGDASRIESASEAISQFTEAVGGKVDVISGEESQQRPIVDALSSTAPSELLFASVAKALSLEDIGGSTLVSGQTEALTWFSKPVSNTAAAYILSRGLAEAFLKEVTYHRVLAANPADWILNHLFMRFYRRGVVIRSFHTKQGIFVNRSILGELPSHTQVS